MVIYTTKLLIDGLSLKIQYFSRAFRMSWSCFLTRFTTVEHNIAVILKEEQKTYLQSDISKTVEYKILN